MRAVYEEAVEEEQRKVTAAVAQVAKLTRERDLVQQRIQVVDTDVAALTTKIEGCNRVAMDAGAAEKAADAESERLRGAAMETEGEFGKARTEITRLAEAIEEAEAKVTDETAHQTEVAELTKHLAASKGQVVRLRGQQ